MLERFTIEGDPERHYCCGCAENVPEVITALQLAYDQDLLIILHDDRVTDEVCMHCQRPIATVLAPPGLYEAEITLTIQCRVSLTARSAPQAHYSLCYLLDTEKFESILEGAETVLSGVRGVEEVNAEDCFYELGEAMPLSADAEEGLA